MDSSNSFRNKIHYINCAGNEEHIYEEINDDGDIIIIKNGSSINGSTIPNCKNEIVYYSKLEDDTNVLNSISPTSSIKSTNSFLTTSSTESTASSISASFLNLSSNSNLNMNQNDEETIAINGLNIVKDDDCCNIGKSIKRVRFSAKQEPNVEQNQQKSLNIINFLNKIRQTNTKSGLSVECMSIDESIELKNLNIDQTATKLGHNSSKFNSILKKSKISTKNLISIPNQIQQQQQDPYYVSYSTSPTIAATITSSSASSVSSRSSLSIKSERNSTTSNDLFDKDNLEHDTQHQTTKQDDFNNIIEEFVTRIMCKTRGNHNCKICNKYKTKSCNEFSSIIEKENSCNQQNSRCNNCFAHLNHLNLTMHKIHNNHNLNINSSSSSCNSNNNNFIKTNQSTKSIIKRSVDDRLSFRVTSLTIDDLKNRFSKNTI